MLHSPAIDPITYIHNLTACYIVPQHRRFPTENTPAGSKRQPEGSIKCLGSIDSLNAMLYTSREVFSEGVEASVSHSNLAIYSFYSIHLFTCLSPPFFSPLVPLSLCPSLPPSLSFSFSIALLISMAYVMRNPDQRIRGSNPHSALITKSQIESLKST